MALQRTTHRKRDNREYEVWRGADGAFHKAPKHAAVLARLKSASRERASMEDRVGKRLRFGAEARGWWYMVRGARWWIRQGTRPAWHHGYYYVPGQMWPVVPPRDTWETRNSYAGIPGQSPLTHLVPKDVRDAASGWHGSGKATGKPLWMTTRGERSPRGEQFASRGRRAGTAEGYRTAKGLKVTKPARKRGR